MNDRIVELEGLVRYHADLYYNKAEPEITDAEFDSLVDELRGLDSENPVLQEVGATASYGKKVKHSSVMGSLDKETTIDGINAWNSKHSKYPQVVVTPKIDGCFTFDSKVMLANGEERRISDIKDGNMVLSYNEKTCSFEPKKVKKVIIRPVQNSQWWVLMTLSSGRQIRCTADHLFLTKNRGWVEAKNLTTDDDMMEVCL